MEYRTLKQQEVEAEVRKQAAIDAVRRELDARLNHARLAAAADCGLGVPAEMVAEAARAAAEAAQQLAKRLARSTLTPAEMRRARREFAVNWLAQVERQHVTVATQAADAREDGTPDEALEDAARAFAEACRVGHLILDEIDEAADA